MLLNKEIVDIEKPDGICARTLVVDEFSGLFLYLSILSIIHSRSAQIINGALSDFWYWLNCNILKSWENIFTLKKSLFSHNFFIWFKLFSVDKEQNQFRQ